MSINLFSLNLTLANSQDLPEFDTYYKLSNGSFSLLKVHINPVEINFTVHLFSSDLTETSSYIEVLENNYDFDENSEISIRKTEGFFFIQIDNDEGSLWVTLDETQLY